MGSLDDEGYLTLKDRSKDVIISGGTNIYPREVEEVLLRHPAVTEVSVIGRADLAWGESVVACVVVDDVSVDARELDDFCRANMTGFKRPKSYHFSMACRRTTTARCSGTLAHAGISTAQVEVIHVANAMGEFYLKQCHFGSMVASVVPELSGIPATRHEAACASGGVAVMAAMTDLESGRYDVALVLGVEIERNVPGAVGAGYMASASWVGHDGQGQTFVWPYTFSEIAVEYDRRLCTRWGYPTWGWVSRSFATTATSAGPVSP
jgi:hypothetical protein